MKLIVSCSRHCVMLCDLHMLSRELSLSPSAILQGRQAGHRCCKTALSLSVCSVEMKWAGSQDYVRQSWCKGRFLWSLVPCFCLWVITKLFLCKPSGIWLHQGKHHCGGELLNKQGYSYLNLFDLKLGNNPFLYLLNGTDIPAGCPASLTALTMDHAGLVSAPQGTHWLWLHCKGLPLTGGSSGTYWVTLTVT